MIKKYRKLPIVILALKYTGKNELEIVAFTQGKSALSVNMDKKCYDLAIYTLEGSMTISEGDYVIKGVNGEFYPCKPDIFEKTYEEVNE